MLDNFYEITAIDIIKEKDNNIQNIQIEKQSEIKTKIKYNFFMNSFRKQLKNHKHKHNNMNIINENNNENELQIELTTNPLHKSRIQSNRYNNNMRKRIENSIEKDIVTST